MAAVPTADDERRVAQFMEMLTRSHELSQSNQLELAEQTGEQALALARTLGEPTYAASALGSLVGIYGLRGQTARAVETGFRGLALAAAIPDVNLCATIHGDMGRVLAPEINRLNRQFATLGTGGQFGDALRVATDLRKRVAQLGDPARLARVLAAEGQLCGMQGQIAGVLEALERAFDAAIPGGTYDLLSQLIGLLNAGLKDLVAGAAVNAPGSDAGAVVSRLGAQARTAEAMLASGVGAKIALVRSRYSAGNAAANLEPLDGLLHEMRSSADRAGLAAVTALKASFVGAQEFMTGDGSGEALELYRDAVAHAVASRNAQLVWSIAADAEKAIESARESGRGLAAAAASRAVERLRSSLQEFAAALGE